MQMRDRRTANQFTLFQIKLLLWFAMRKRATKTGQGETQASRVPRDDAGERHTEHNQVARAHAWRHRSRYVIVLCAVQSVRQSQRVGERMGMTPTAEGRMPRRVRGTSKGEAAGAAVLSLCPPKARHSFYVLTVA